MSHIFAREDTDGTIKGYNVYDIWEITKDFPVLDLDLDIVIRCINSNINHYTADDWLRVQEANLEFPIIVNAATDVIDGCHRSVKAMLLGHTKIKAVRLDNLPNPIQVWDNWTDYDANP